VSRSSSAQAQADNPDYAISDRLQEARRYELLAQQAASAKFSAWLPPATPNRLRIGFVSGDLRNHPVGFILEALISRIDPERIELAAYPAHSQQDDPTARIRPRFAAKRSLIDLSGASMAQTISHRWHSSVGLAAIRCNALCAKRRSRSVGNVAALGIAAR
jgi:predicted O-linked N-acetylglucosamine transferase (SPINDLY family)